MKTETVHPFWWMLMALFLLIHLLTINRLSVYVEDLKSRLDVIEATNDAE